jgi:hypothetical protein
MNPGKSKAAYLSRDVNSDDEDMEVGIDEVEREEARRCAFLLRATKECRLTQKSQPEDRAPGGG